MDPLIMTALSSIISALVGAIVSGVLTKAKAASGRQAALEDGMKTLLKAELYDLHYRFVECGEEMDAMGMQLAASTYAAYHDGLGGNGLGTKLFEDISSRSIRK
jgi:hypothetical protein